MQHGQRLIETIEHDVRRTKGKNPFIKLNHYVSSAARFHVERLSPRKPRVNLAFVSLPKFPEDPDVCWLDPRWSVEEDVLPQVDHKACQRQILHYHRHFSARHVKWYKESLTEAVRRGADIIVVNELGFPSYDQKPLKKVADFTRRLAKNNDCFIVAGSSHDKRTLYNTGYIFYPGCPAFGEQYHKQVSAIAAEELISIPPKRRTVSTRVFGLQVAVLICLDVADYSSVATVVKIADKVDLLLVPCYSQWMDSLEKVARVTGDALSGMVALVNYRRRAQKAPCIIAKLGKTIEPGGSVEIQVDENGTETSPTSHPLVTFYTINTQQFEREQIQWQVGEERQQTRWLFGPRNLDPR